MGEAIINENGNYEIPEELTSRTAEILQVYLKSLGVRMETIYDEDEYIGDESDNDIVAYTIMNRVIFCTPNEMYYCKKLAKTYKNYLRDNPADISNFDEAWDYVINNLPFKKKYLTDDIYNIFIRNIEAFTLK